MTAFQHRSSFRPQLTRVGMLACRAFIVLGRASYEDLPMPAETLRFLEGFCILAGMISTKRNNSMEKLRLAFFGSLFGVLLVSALAQQGAAHLLSADELKEVVPSLFFFRGQPGPTLARNTARLRSAHCN